MIPGTIPPGRDLHSPDAERVIVSDVDVSGCR